MGPYIVISAAVLIIGIPELIWNIRRIKRRRASLLECASKPFVCPNCGFVFYAEPSKLYHASENRASLKCPNCNKRDSCTRPYDFEK